MDNIIHRSFVFLCNIPCGYLSADPNLEDKTVHRIIFKTKSQIFYNFNCGSIFHNIQNLSECEHKTHGASATTDIVISVINTTY